MKSQILAAWAACLIVACGCSDTDRRQPPTVASTLPDPPAAKPIPENASPEQLVDSLRELESITVGLHPTAFASAFLANGDNPEFSGGVLGSQAPQANPAMKRLVQLGVDAIPALISHLDDKRPTKLKVGSQFPIMAKWFDEEYDPRSGVSVDDKNGDQDRDLKNAANRSFNDDYTVKVGDVCYVLIGQIVNRALLAVRYQPSGCMVVNSPVESSDLADRVRRDWAGLTKQQHIDSLTQDLARAESGWHGLPALERLQYYYPETLTSLRQGELKTKIAEIEAKSRE